MNRTMKRASDALLMLCFVAAASACSVMQDKTQTGDTDPDYALIVENLLDVLGSDERLHYTRTTFQIVEPKTPVGQALSDKLSEKGYGVQVVPGDVGDNFIRYKAEVSQTEQGAQELYSLAVRNIRVERQYTKVDGKTVPISPVTVTTDEPFEADLDDRLFGVEIDPEISQVLVVDSSAPELVVVNRTEVASDGSGFMNGPAISTPLRNVRDITESNFAALFEQYDDVSSMTLIFPNESLTLGERNNTILKSLAGEINPETDLISIIGCSHGRTNFQNGNQLLAEGRTQRVTESLMFAGVKPDLIMDEACWANEYWDERAPRRGVMVTHKRLKS